MKGKSARSGFFPFWPLSLVMISFFIHLSAPSLSAQERHINLNNTTYSYNPLTGSITSPHEIVSSLKSRRISALMGLVQPNENIWEFPPVIIGQDEYRAFCFSTDSIVNIWGEDLTLDIEQDWTHKGIRGFCVLDGSENVVTREETLRKVFMAFRDGYLFWSYGRLKTDEIINTMLDNEKPSGEQILLIRNLNDNLAYKLVFLEPALEQFFSSLLKGGSDIPRYEAALQGMVVSESKVHIQPELKNLVFQGILAGDTAYQVISDLARAARYSPNYQLQRYARKLEVFLKSITTVRTAGGAYGKILRIKGTDVNILWTVHLVNLVTALAEERVYSEDRIERLEKLLDLSRNARGFKSEIAAAMDRIVQESRMSRDEEIFDNFYNFLIDYGPILAVQSGEDVLIKALSDWIWQAHKAGAKAMWRHHLASILGNVALGLHVSNLLWGMDSIYADGINAKAAWEIKEELKGLFAEVYKREMIEDRYPADYCGELSSIAAFIKLCSASFFRSIAGIAGSSQLKTFVVDSVAARMGGQSMSDVIQFNMQRSSAIEEYVEKAFISPPAVEYAVQTARTQTASWKDPSTASMTSTEPLNSTVLLLDVSGSMSSSWKGGIKIASMKEAAGRIINMLSAENTLGNTRHQIGVVSFDDVAKIVSPLNADSQDCENAIPQLGPGGSTNIGDSLIKGLQLLGQQNVEVNKIMVLLTDGKNNEGYTNEQVLSGPVAEAKNLGIRIFTIGFGDAGSIDEEFLKLVAQATNAQYYYALDAYRLDNVYVSIGHKTDGNLLDNFTGEIAQGDRIIAGSFSVPYNSPELRITLNWPGSRLGLLLKDPRGIDVHDGYPGYQLFKQSKPIYAVIRNPISGTWVASVEGVDIPQGKTSFEIVGSIRRPASQFAGGGFPSDSADYDWLPFIVFVLCMGCLGLSAAILYILKKRRPESFIRRR